MKRKKHSIRLSKDGILTPKKIVKAIPESGGVISVIAKRCNVSYSRIQNALRKKGVPWDFVRRKFFEEAERITDIAESTIQEMISQRLDLNLAAKTAMWYLQKKRPEYADKSKVEVTSNQNSTVFVLTHKELSALPLDTRLALLKTVQGKVIEK